MARMNCNALDAKLYTTLQETICPLHSTVPVPPPPPIYLNFFYNETTALFQDRVPQRSIQGFLNGAAWKEFAAGDF